MAPLHGGEDAEGHKLKSAKSAKSGLPVATSMIKGFLCVFSQTAKVKVNLCYDFLEVASSYRGGLAPIHQLQGALSLTVNSSIAQTQ